MKLQDLVKLKPFIEAIEQGKTIQWSLVGTLNTENKFYDIPDDINAFQLVSVLCGDTLLAIKPEPREWVIDVIKNELAPPQMLIQLQGQSRFIRVREVLE